MADKKVLSLSVQFNKVKKILLDSSFVPANYNSNNKETKLNNKVVLDYLTSFIKKFNMKVFVPEDGKFKRSKAIVTSPNGTITYSFVHSLPTKQSFRVSIIKESNSLQLAFADIGSDSNYFATDITKDYTEKDLEKAVLS